MNYNSIRYMLSRVMTLEAVFLLFPALVALVYGETEGFVFLACAVVTAIVGTVFCMYKPANTTIFAKEGFIIVALSWIILSIIGAIPLQLSGAIPSYIDALFEIVSGFTTTGASIIPNVELMPRCVLFWRSFSHWVGGMGVLVFMLAVIPLAGGYNMHLMRAESPGPSVGKLVPRLRQTAKILYIMYFALTVIELVLLVAGGMPFFDSICTALGTAGTGGFGNKADSMDGYSYYIQVVVTIFMFLFGVNFTFYYLIINKKWRDALKMEEVRVYTGIFVAAVVLITLNLVLSCGGDFGVSLNDAAFSVSSVMTTTGFATADFNNWPTFSKMLLVILMFGGACAGSTGGGIKISRIILYVKQARVEIVQSIHSRSVNTVKMEGKPVRGKMLQGANAFLMVYIILFIFSVIIVSFDDFGFTTTFTAVTATINNIGPGLDMVGPAGNYADFSVLSKIVLIFDMLLGRLEIFPMILLFTPVTWKK